MSDRPRGWAGATKRSPRGASMPRGHGRSADGATCNNSLNREEGLAWEKCQGKW
jgi:hypothetical protein